MVSEQQAPTTGEERGRVVRGVAIVQLPRRHLVPAAFVGYVYDAFMGEPPPRLPVAPGDIAVANIARHVIDTNLNPSFLSQTASYDVVSNIYQAQPGVRSLLTAVFHGRLELALINGALRPPLPPMRVRDETDVGRVQVPGRHAEPRK
jgi:hypothetical protein